MSSGGVILLVCLLGIFTKGLSVMIQTQETVMAAVGEDAHFRCQLIESKVVLQVTWQRVLPEREVNLATYSDIFGPKVHFPYLNKVDFQETGLQNCSIVLRNVTKQDESCYRCLFYTYSDGALTGNMCLKVYGQPQPVLLITKSNSSEESLVSCSATGPLALTVTLIVPGRGLGSSNYSTVSVTNPNGTVTVTATAALSGCHGNGTQARCVVRLFSGAVMKVFTTIPDADRSSCAGLHNTSGEAEIGFSKFMFSWWKIYILDYSHNCFCNHNFIVICVLVRRKRLQDGVKQVTWQRLHQDKPLETLTTYSKRFGSQINEPHRGKVLFTEASLSSTSITVKSGT
ncbi:uncharacterized protein ACN63O_019083 [Diretmus argenteus]